MLLDRRTTFCENTAIGAGTGRRALGDAIDLQSLRDIGADANVYLVVQMSVTATSGGAGTLQIELVTDAQDPPLVDGSATEHITSQVFALANLAAGAELIKMVLPIESQGATYERYLSIIANVGTAALTAGSINAFLTLQPPVHRSYRDGDR
jgi:hypothetical protein